MLNEKNLLEVLNSLNQLGVSIDEYLVLLANSKGNEVIEGALYMYIPNLQGLKKALINKGMLDKRGIRTKLAYKIPGLKPEAKDFESFWKEYPSSDQWGSWTKTRVLRSNKSRARTLYNQAVREVGHDNLIMALKHDVALKQKSSLMRNEMRFMPAITAWLSKAAYEAILEDLESEQVKAENTTRYEGEVD
jgi:hypothetical protein